MIIHIRCQQINKKKSVTIIEGFEDDIDVKKICKAMRKLFACNGSVQKSENDLDIILLQGDHRTKTRDFLNKVKIANEIIVHGY